MSDSQLPEQRWTGVLSRNADGDPIPRVSMTVEPDREWLERNCPEWPYTSNRPAQHFKTRRATAAEKKAADTRKVPVTEEE